MRPGGQLAITTWGLRMFEPGSAAFWQAIQAERPNLYRGFNPWDRITEPNALHQLLTEGGVADAQVVAEDGSQALSSPDDFWSVVLGSGFRGTLDQLEPAAQERVREATLAVLHANHVERIETNVLYALATKR